MTAPITHPCTPRITGDSSPSFLPTGEPHSCQQGNPTPANRGTPLLPTGEPHRADIPRTPQGRHPLLAPSIRRQGIPTRLRHGPCGVTGRVGRSGTGAERARHPRAARAQGARGGTVQHECVATAASRGGRTERRRRPGWTRASLGAARPVWSGRGLGRLGRECSGVNAVWCWWVPWCRGARVPSRVPCNAPCGAVEPSSTSEVQCAG